MDETNFKTKETVTENDVIAFYDAYAEAWDDRFGASFSSKYFIERRWRSFNDALRLCGSKKSLAVELGVGTGVYIDRVAAAFSEVIAVDGSRKMLDSLSVRLNNLGLTNVSIVCSDVVDLAGIESGTVDCVYFFGLIEHIINLVRFAAEIRRILKPGGVLIGITPNGTSPWYVLRRFVRGTGKHCSSDKYHTESTLNEIFLPVGFTLVSMDYWGAVPAGVGDLVAKVLAKSESLLETSLLKKWLGGLTFIYRL